MRRMYIKIGINASFSLLFILLFVFLYDRTVPQKTEDYIFNQVVVLKNKVVIESIPNSNTYAIIRASYEALSRSDEFIGTVYELHIKNAYVKDPNKGYGDIKLYLGIDLNGKIFVKEIILEQTSVYLENIKYFIYDALRNKTLKQIEETIAYDAAIDLNTGATATDSTSTILQLVIKAARIHFGTDIKDPWVVFYGEGYEIVSETIYDTIVSYVIKDLGVVYEVTQTGPYEGYDGPSSGAITLQILTDVDEKIIGIIPVMERYKHTTSYLLRNKSYLDGFIGLTLSEIRAYLDFNSDLKTGATGSKELMDEIFEILILEVLQ
jgi:hypothetical protein